MRLFLDTANLDELRRASAWGVVDGVTTNPTLIAREGRPTAEQIRAICEIIDGPISAEVIGLDTASIVNEGRELAAIHPNVVVKAPLTRDGIAACKLLSAEGIRVNVTLCFSAAQAILAAKAGAAYVSPFAGRLDDIGQEGMDLIRSIVAIYEQAGFDTQVLAASLRSPLHVIQAAEAGADVATLPFKLLDSLFNHPLTDRGLEQFLKDYERAFPSGG